MLPYLNIFGLSLPVPELIILMGTYFGLMLVERFAAIYGQKGEVLYEMGFYSLFAGFIGARLAYAVEHLDAFTKNPRSLISLNTDLFDPVGGMAIALLTGIIYGQRKNLKLWPTLDGLTPTFALYLVALPLANFASGDAYGAPTQLPWAIDLWGALRHPTQVYEAIGASIIFYYLWPNKQQSKWQPGSAFLRFVMLSAGARLFFEAFRGSSATLIFNIRTVQILAWILFALAAWGYARIHQPDKKHESE